ncbi:MULTISPECIES: TIGR00730 family Rossman fold protein [Stappiaceae]|uniref:Cytokinin riboside 5'-monophosphate phosphoribohydrolase n=1 Tax=Roseibium aggregatum TaxID=187304 RepID=A0A0M6Y0W4_9HYPH|nr:MULTISPECIES: TIGR00730 family Rossman fold protein [Stappiaceae]MCR9284881.1 TIGR00730 family Rossman fold protein [Paracoccaceae bacterium]MEC9418444.1 TIGR00730 family Rossman fold protein [Pseudomonadota bacterium]NKX66183.1 TIGR00730 family Rossman fold protein [Labrenzia sp. 5N]CTQ42896.1 LOG family protein YvdD [Roseibium aggregatum]
MKSICVFCGSSYGALEAYADIARETGRAIAEQGYTLVYGGAKVGLMGTVADAALAAGGKVIGVLPRSLQDKEIGHEGLSELHLVDSMHERKAMMADLSDAFIALPGGVGTLEEIFEVWTWGQLGYHKKPCGFLNAEGYYDHLIAFLDHQTEQGFTKQVMRDMAQIASSPLDMIRQFENYTPPSAPKWINRDET